MIYVVAIIAFLIGFICGFAAMMWAAVKVGKKYDR